jgi:hypothetical protein
VTGRPERGDGRVAEGDLVVIVQSLVDVSDREWGVGQVEGSSAAALDDVDVALHHPVLRPGFAKDLGRAGNMIEMSVAAEQDLRILPAETKLLNAVANLGGELSRVELMRIFSLGVTIR